MRLGKPTGDGQDLRITGFTPFPGMSVKEPGILVIEMTWDEWDVLVADAEHLRATGEFRG